METNHHHPIENQSSANHSDAFSAAAELALCKAQIKDIWEDRIRKLIASSANKTSLALRNTLGIFLDELVLVLRNDPKLTDDLIYEGMSKVHGETRAGFSGYFLPQLLKEFSLLREVLNETLRNKGLLTYEVRSIIDKAVDSVISAAATEFSAVQQAGTKAALLKSELSNIDLERFAAVAAHDLKSPLATISGYLNLLDDEFATRLGEEGIQFVRLMISASERMRNLVDRLLEYARLTSAKNPLQPTNIASVIKSATENLESVMAETKATVAYGKLPVVMGDSGLLTQLFQNLIANAIKFRRNEPPSIVIDVLESDDWIFSLKDNGIGFDSKFKSEIFNLYKRLHSEQEYHGTGIGLASCKRVVEIHGGKIWAESIPGVGSTFYFSIPKLKGDRQALH